MESPKSVFVVKQYTVREVIKWQYAVHKAKIGRYAVSEGMVTLIVIYKYDNIGEIKIVYVIMFGTWL